MLADWYMPRKSICLSEAKLEFNLSKSMLVLDRQLILDSGICPDQWTMERSQAAQPFNAFKRKLISHISAQRQSQVILMTNADRMAQHRHNINNAMTDATQEAFCPVRERDLFSLGPQNMVMRELDLDYHGPLFSEICLEQPELWSIMGDQVSQEVQIKILTAVRQAHVSNLERLQVSDSKVRSLYSAGLGLINDGVESYRGYGQIQTALDVCQQSISAHTPYMTPPHC